MNHDHRKAGRSLSLKSWFVITGAQKASACKPINTAISRSAAVQTNVKGDLATGIARIAN